ncbi:MAG: hypothetical protein ACK53Y_11550, partial [bacterium]
MLHLIQLKVVQPTFLTGKFSLKVQRSTLNKSKAFFSIQLHQSTLRYKISRLKNNRGCATW